MATKDTIIEDMLKNLPDSQRKAYGAIVNGEITHLVHCDSKTCKGKVIAHIYADGRVVETDLVIDKKGKYGLYSSGLEGSRQRLDGNWGFRCYCGNNSILAEAEQGQIGRGAPSKENIETIAQRLSKKPTKVAIKGDKIAVDGFTVEKVRV